LDSIAACVAAATGAPASSIRVAQRPPLEMQSNRLYEAWAGDRRLIVKEFLKPDEYQDAPRREYAALQLLAPLDVAPQPVFYRPEPTASLGPLVLYEYLEGEMWGQRKPSPAELGQLAALWLRLSALPTEGLWLSRGYERSLGEGALEERVAQFRAQFEAYAEWAEAQFKPALRAAEQCLDLADRCLDAVRALQALDAPLCFCRSDPRFANVIRRPDGRLAMVDWEDSGLRDPARDLADVMTHPYQEDRLTADDWQALLEPYLAGRSALDPRLARRVQLYLALFPVFWLAVLIRAGIHADEAGHLANWRSNGMPPNQRLRRYLARGLAWPERAFKGQLATVADVTFFPDLGTKG
jgi:aminoglycoside phosphotransferase (APT) family kinase protein